MDYREAATALDARNELLDSLCASCRSLPDAEADGKADLAAPFAELRQAHDEAAGFGQRLAGGLLSHLGSFDDLVNFLRVRDRNRLAIQQAAEMLNAHDLESGLKRTG